MKGRIEKLMISCSDLRMYTRLHFLSTFEHVQYYVLSDITGEQSQRVKYSGRYENSSDRRYMNTPGIPCSVEQGYMNRVKHK